MGITDDHEKITNFVAFCQALLTGERVLFGCNDSSRLET